MVNGQRTFEFEGITDLTSTFIGDDPTGKFDPDGSPGTDDFPQDGGQGWVSQDGENFGGSDGFTADLTAKHPPLAYIVEQAGGQASDGNERILDMKLVALQKRVPLIFGSSDRVQEVIDYMTGDAVENTRFPLFENRSLFRN